MKKTTDKIHPQAIEVEEAVLGAAMLEAEALKTITTLLVPEVFYKPIHQIIYKAILSIQSRKDSVDILSVTQELVKQKEIANIGGPFFITTLTDRVASGANSETHCRILQQLFLKRELINLGNKIVEEGYDDFKDVFQQMADISKRLKEIDSYIVSEALISNEQTIDEVYLDIETAKANGGIIGYSTGMKSLDHGIMGLRKGLKYVVGGTPGAGKTSLVKSICIHLAKNENVPGVFFSMEMTRKQMMMACISEILQIDNELLQKGEITHFDKQNILDIKKAQFSKNFIIDDRGGLDPRDIRARIIKLIETHKIEWFAVDYLQLIKLKGKENQGKMIEQVISDITADLKNICKEYNLIGFELSQLSREVTKRGNFRPMLSDFKYSGAIEANADVVIFPYRPEYYGIKSSSGLSTEGYAELILAKNRFGKVKNLAARYYGMYTQFTDHEEGIELESTPSDYSEDNAF